MTQQARWVCPECGASYGGEGTCPADQTVIEPADDPFLGQTIGSYRVTKLLGAGGMGRVYKGVQPSIGARVAIKVLSTDLGQNRELVERFFAEARAVNLIRHEQIINIVDLSFLPDGRPFIIMEYLEGSPLSSLMRARGPLPLGSFAQLMLECLGALAAAHDRQIIHRDLKPDNIFVSPQGRATVLDFGIAKLDPGLGGQSGATKAGAIMGTPQYMSPEQALARPVDARTDVYSMGVILYEGATGRVPFESESLFGILDQHLNQPPAPPRGQRPDLPPAYEAVILRAMAKDPSQRFGTAGEMAAALHVAASAVGPEGWVPLGTGRLPTSQMGAITPMMRPSTGHGSLPQPTVPPTMVQPSGGRKLGMVWLALAGLAVGGLGVGATALVMRGGDKQPVTLGGPVAVKAPAVVDAGQAKPVEKEGGPPRLTVSYSNQGYILNFVFRKMPLEVKWRMAGDPEFRSTGQNTGYLDPDTGVPVAKTWAMLDVSAKKGTVQVKYRTAGEIWHGPYDLTFDPAEIAVREARDQLDMLPRWIEMREYDGKLLAYFTHLISHRGALTVIEYGFDADPSKKLRFTPSDSPTREIPSDDEIYIVVPPGTKQVTVRLTFRDGEKTEVRKFDTPQGGSAPEPPKEEKKPKGTSIPATGVPECDDVFRDVMACYAKIAPAAVSQVADGFRQTAQAIKQGVAQGVPATSYVDTCKQIRASMKESLEAQGCKF